MLGILAGCGPTDVTTPAATQAIEQAAQALSPTLEVGNETAVSNSTTTSGPHEQPTVVAGNGMYLVVWVENRQEEPPDLRGMRIRASDGMRLDPSPLLIGKDFLESTPAVAFDGSNFLVSWMDNTSYFSSRGVRVRASDGVILDSSPQFVTSRDRLFQTPNQLSFDGTNYISVFEALVGDGEDNYEYKVLASRVRPSDGQVLDEQAIHIGVIPELDAPFHVASQAGTTLIAWANDGVKSARIDSTGAVLDATPIALSSVSANKLRIAARPGEFLVVWNEGSSLKARRVRASDGVLLDASAITVATGADVTGNTYWRDMPFDVTFDGQDYRVLWQSTTSQGRQVKTTRVSTAGTIDPDAQDTLATYDASTPMDWVGLASQGPSRFLVTYTQQEPGSGQTRAMYRLVNPDPCLHDVTPPTVTCPATFQIECRYSAQTILYGATFEDSCGFQNVSRPPVYYGRPGTFTSSVGATDLAGNSTSCTTEWTVVDTDKPTVYRMGPPEIILRYGEPYVDPGAYAYDECDGYMYPEMGQVYGTVDPWTPGFYMLTYVFTDSSGNENSYTLRAVRVLDP
ncbi:MAG: immunoglobulin-like domain-containing protein [Cystobacter sp.]